jgi:hypothetical protein
MKPQKWKVCVLGVALGCLFLASCSSGPKVPDPFDTLMIEAAREMFKDTTFDQP